MFVFKPRIQTTCYSIIVQKPPEKPPKQLWFNPIFSPNRIKSASNHILDCLFQISLANWFRFLCLHSDHLTWKKNPSSTIQQWQNYWCFLFTKHGINLSCSYLFGFQLLFLKTQEDMHGGSRIKSQTKILRKVNSFRFVKWWAVVMWCGLVSVDFEILGSGSWFG